MKLHRLADITLIELKRVERQVKAIGPEGAFAIAETIAMARPREVSNVPHRVLAGVPWLSAHTRALLTETFRWIAALEMRIQRNFGNSKHLSGEFPFLFSTDPETPQPIRLLPSDLLESPEIIPRFLILEERLREIARETATPVNAETRTHLCKLLEKYYLQAERHPAQCPSLTIFETQIEGKALRITLQPCRPSLSPSPQGWIPTAVVKWDGFELEHPYTRNDLKRLVAWVKTVASTHLVESLEDSLRQAIEPDEGIPPSEPASQFFLGGLRKIFDKIREARPTYRARFVCDFPLEPCYPAPTWRPARLPLEHHAQATLKYLEFVLAQVKERQLLCSTSRSL